jgi:hypothetical protein
MIVYKWTDDNLRTFGGHQWAVGVPATTDGRGDLCGPGWLHAYRDPLLAVLFAPLHVPDTYTQLWEAEADGQVRDDGTKLGVTRLTLLRAITPPAVTTAQRVRWAIACAWEVCDDPEWRRWAAAWCDGSDRSAASAARAAEAASASAARAARAARAASAASAAARAARAARAALAWAAEAALAAARAAAWAAEAAGTPLDVLALARRAIAEEAGE